MKCDRVQDLFSSYLEGNMDSPSKTEFERHLADCPQCSAAYDSFNAAVMMLEELPEVEPPADLHATVMARLEKSRRTAARPVQWWKIDWAHVFTIRVPARAAAMGLAVLLMFALVVQLTPVGTTVASFFGITKNDTTLKAGVNEEDAPPPWNPWSPNSIGNAGLTIGVTRDSGGAYALRLGTASGKAVAFDLQAASKNYSGFVVKNQESVVKVPMVASAESVVAKVTWDYKDATRSEFIFLPSKFNEKSAARKLDLTFENKSMYNVLRSISEKYGVVILAAGDMSKRVSMASVNDGNPTDALYALESAGVNRSTLATSVYAVEVAR